MRNNIKTVELERFQMEFGQRLPMECIDRFHLEPDNYDELAEGFIIRIRAFVWGERITEPDHVIKHPVDWWQSFKLRWFPKWALKKWPAKIKHHVILGRCLYPEFRPSLPDKRSVITMLTCERIKFDEEES